MVQFHIRIHFLRLCVLLHNSVNTSRAYLKAYILIQPFVPRYPSLQDLAEQDQHKNQNPSYVHIAFCRNPQLQYALCAVEQIPVHPTLRCLFGGCPNTTYGESVGTVAISGNASIRTIFVTAILAIVLSFLLPFSTFLATIPSCVMGGVCIALYGFIAVSGLKMIQPVDLGDNRNLFVVSVILIAGVGGFTLNIALGNNGVITITEIACALILGILVNLVVHIGDKKKAEEEPVEEEQIQEEAQDEEGAGE